MDILESRAGGKFIMAKTVRHLFALLAFVIMPGLAVAQSQERIIEQAGNWDGSIINGSAFVAHSANDGVRLVVGMEPNKLLVEIPVPSQSGQTVTLNFDDGYSLQLSPQNATFEADVDASGMAAFIHGLTSSKAVIVQLPSGSSSVSLVGSSFAVEAMSFYAKEHDISLPAPFTPATVISSNAAPAPSNDASSTSPPAAPQLPDQAVASNPPLAISTPAQGQALTTAAPSTSPIEPASEEQSLIDTVGQFAMQNDAAPNEMAKAGIRSARATAICEEVHGYAVSGWVGKIATLSSTGSGNGVLSIAISPKVSLSTVNNDISASLGDNTAIPAGSALFNAVAAMRVGDQVTFNGQFVPSGRDCLNEDSLTTDGSMDNPEFDFEFTAVRDLSQ